jgi:hypothetical protein
MKKNIKLIACGLMASVSMLPVSASAAGLYAGASGDLTWPNHADMGGGGNLNLGYRFAPDSMGSMRAEAEVGYHWADGDNGFGDRRYFNYMGNVYYDLASSDRFAPSGWRVSPYVGAGLGLAEIRNGHSSFTSAFRHNTNAFAYQGMAGLSFTSATAPKSEWRIGYRYLGTNRENGDRLHANNLQIGYNYHF